VQDFESVLRKIVGEAGVSREEVLRLIEEKKKRMGGLLSDEGAAQLVARELGVDLPVEVEEVSVWIGDVNPDMSNVSLRARVMRVLPLRTYTTRDGKKGVYSSLILGDRTGRIRLVAWGEKAEQAVKLIRGQMVRVSRAYPKRGIGEQGEIELHLGFRGSIKPVDERVSEEDYPMPETRICRVSELKPDMREVDFRGVVEHVGEVKEFTRSDGVKGTYRRLVLSDGEQYVTLVVWNNSVEEHVRVGDTVLVENAYTKPGYLQQDRVELHAGSRTLIRVLRRGGREAA